MDRVYLVSLQVVPEIQIPKNVEKVNQKHPSSTHSREPHDLGKPLDLRLLGTPTDMSIYWPLCLDQSSLTGEQSSQLESLLLEYSNVFAPDPSELGSTDLGTHSIDTGSCPPISQPVRCTPFALRNKVEELVQEILDQGVIRPSQSPWASPICAG